MHCVRLNTAGDALRDKILAELGTTGRDTAEQSLSDRTAEPKSLVDNILEDLDLFQIIVDKIGRQVRDCLNDLPLEPGMLREEPYCVRSSQGCS
jgi:hypothetical protein